MLAIWSLVALPFLNPACTSGNFRFTYCLKDFEYCLANMSNNDTPLQYSCLENPRDGGAWWAAVYGVAQSRTRLKWLSSSSSSSSNMWNEHSCPVVWRFFGIVFLWDWNVSWTFPVLWPLLSFPNLLVYWVQHFSSISFRICNSSPGIPSLTIALFIVILPKACLTSHCKMFGYRWMTTILWLSGD